MKLVEGKKIREEINEVEMKTIKKNHCILGFPESCMLPESLIYLHSDTS